MNVYSVLALSAVVLTLTSVGVFAKEKPAYCGACKAVIDELQYSISKEDKHKTIEVGGLGLDSRGNQRGIKRVKYAGSETHISELLEKVCDLMQNYGQTSDPKTGKKGYMRINSRAGESITISNVNFSSGGTAELKAACEYFVSEHDEDLIQLFQENFTQKELEYELCEEITGYCKDDGRHSEL